MMHAKPFTHWVSGGGTVQPVLLDHVPSRFEVPDPSNIVSI